MAKFFEDRDYRVFCLMAKVLGFTEDEAYKEEPLYRWFSKDHFQLTVGSDSTFRLYKDGKSVSAGTWPADMIELVDASKEDIYADQEEWLASRATAAATYRRLAEKRAEEARREEGGMSSLELSLMRAHRDLQKTKKIVEEGHQ